VEAIAPGEIVLEATARLDGTADPTVVEVVDEGPTVAEDPVRTTTDRVKLGCFGIRPRVESLLFLWRAPPRVKKAKIQSRISREGLNAKSQDAKGISVNIDRSPSSRQA
jgi:hypothetical protein